VSERRPVSGINRVRKIRWDTIESETTVERPFMKSSRKKTPRKIPFLTGILLVSLPACVTAESYRIGDLHLRLPEGYRLISRDVETLPPPFPGAESTTEYLATFRSKDGKSLHLFHWRGDAPRDRGVMQAKELRRIRVAGLACIRVRTSQFMGIEQRVEALFCPIGDRSGFTLHSPDLKQSRFDELLRGISLRHSSESRKGEGNSPPPRSTIQASGT
jgi:hypothetical protein